MFNSALKRQLESCTEDLAKFKEFVDSIKDNIAVIEFTPDGTILNANSLFLDVVGYQLHEIEGKHHRMFCDPQYASTQEYSSFWQSLSQGKTQGGVFLRYGKGGGEAWLEATYFPVMRDGKVYKVVKFAAEVTEKTNRLKNQEAIFNALNKSLAVIEFNPDGEILTANQNFTDCVGYSLSEIQGRHHKLFCYSAFYEENPNFWADLAAGDFKSGQFERKNSKDETLWLEATYNPVFDDNGKVIKVIKFASDITQTVHRNQSIEEAANVAYNTSSETTQIAEEGSCVLAENADVSKNIAGGVNNAADLIKELNKQSDKIKDIVTTISEIADQTNLLALNAAIEAARAGEQGRGFAVVADEVRMLAARTSTSTLEIGEVVKKNIDMTEQAMVRMEGVINMVNKGEELSSKAADVIEKIKVGAQDVSERLSTLTTTK